jgi:hypothetical protein
MNLSMMGLWAVVLAFLGRVRNRRWWLLGSVCGVRSESTRVLSICSKVKLWSLGIDAI